MNKRQMGVGWLKCSNCRVFWLTVKMLKMLLPVLKRWLYVWLLTGWSIARVFPL